MKGPNSSMSNVVVVSFDSPNSTEPGIPSVARMRTMAGLELLEPPPFPGGPGGGALDQRRSAAKRRSVLDGKCILLLITHSTNYKGQFIRDSLNKIGLFTVEKLI